MFTGIITKSGKIGGIRNSKGNLLVRVSAPSEWRIKESNSVSVNGICSTVKKSEHGMALFEYMPETLRKTTANMWCTGDVLNLEKSLRMGDPLDGHVVTGHVDGVAKIQSIEKEGASRVFSMKVQPSKKGRSFLSLLAPKGAVAIDGVSLTVVDADDEQFSVALIPYTLSHTNLQKRKVGDLVNVEADITSKYLLRLMARRAERA